MKGKGSILTAAKPAWLYELSPQYLSPHCQQKKIHVQESEYTPPYLKEAGRSFVHYVNTVYIVCIEHIEQMNSWHRA